MNQVGIERNSLSVRNTHLALAAASARIRPWAMHSPIGFSQAHVLARPDRRQGDGDVPVVGRGDHHRVDVLAGEHLAEVGRAEAALQRVEVELVPFGHGDGGRILLAELETPAVHVAQGDHLRVGRPCTNTGRLWAIACRPRPIIPTPIRLLGATFPSAPRAEAGTMVGIARPAPKAAPVAARKRRRENRPRLCSRTVICSSRT